MKSMTNFVTFYFIDDVDFSITFENDAQFWFDFDMLKLLRYEYILTSLLYENDLDIRNT